MSISIGINGFGCIGRQICRIVLRETTINVLYQGLTV